MGAAARSPSTCTEFHVYAVEWAADHVAFFVDDALVTVVGQSPAYPMQFMLGDLRLPGRRRRALPPASSPREFVVDRFTAYRPATIGNPSGRMSGMRHSLYESEHDEFRAMVRAWAEKNVAPFHAQWEKDGIVPRDVWLSGGKQGLLGMDLEEQYGGGGVRDFRYNAVTRRGDGPDRRERRRVRPAQRRHRALPARPRHRRAEAALAARLLQR